MRLAAILLVGLAALAAADSPLRADDAQSADDGWRRTAHGWERVAAWRDAAPLPMALRYRFSSDDADRKSFCAWDFHPALLVGVQLLAVAVGFAASPQGTRRGRLG